MTLTDKARGLHKQAMLGGLVASHIGQNIIGKPIAKSKWFQKDVARAGIMGALHKQSPRSAKTYGKDALMGVAAPEVNAAKNTAYEVGRSKSKELHNKIRKSPEYKKARASQKANGGKLNLPMSTKRDLVKKRQGLLKDTGLTKAEFKDVQKLPTGSRLPSSNKAALAANAALAVVPGGTSTAAVNAAKLGAGTKAFSNSKIGKILNDKLVAKPMKDAYSKGRSGGKFSKVKNSAQSTLMNPFTAHAESLAHKAGKRTSK